MNNIRKNIEDHIRPMRKVINGLMAFYDRKDFLGLFDNSIMAEDIFYEAQSCVENVCKAKDRGMRKRLPTWMRNMERNV